MAFEHYTYTGTKRLRMGYTTGSCAALAAQAAATMLLEQREVLAARIITPKGLEVAVEVEAAAFGTGWARCGVRKDGGDDIDATDGALIVVEVRASDAPGVTIKGGAGVGTVTRPGLNQPVGSPAINATPRAMIASEIEAVYRSHGVPCAIEAIVSVEGGEEIAPRTFNPNLGITGGISILGTTGIVEPRSLAALRESIELEMHQHATEGARGLVIVPGNMGRTFLRENPALARLAEVPVVECANFLGDALDCAAREGFAQVLVVGHLGKMAKVAGGIMDTHSRVADCRTEVICAHAAAAGASPEAARELLACATTDACLATLERERLMAPTLASLAGALQMRLERRAAGASERGEVMRTETAGEVIEALAQAAGAHAAAPHEGRTASHRGASQQGETPDPGQTDAGTNE